MWRGVLLVLAGLAAGFAIAWWQGSAAPSLYSPLVPSSPEEPPPAAGGAASSDVARLAAALESERAERAALGARVDELAAALEAVTLAASADMRSAARETHAPAEPRSAPGFGGRIDVSPGDSQARELERLVAAGFAPDRADWIARRTAELRVAQMQARYAAAREGRPVDPAAMQGERTLRSELGDADYERYLQALDRPTSVGVREVIASSPGEQAGLEAGDEIVAYDGKRVFDLRDLNALTLEGRAGESVVVQVRRDGRVLDLVMPRGPIGIFGGGFGGFRGR
jgi:membrane-associated protease RseP (regulator of RpoE activity)